MASLNYRDPNDGVLKVLPLAGAVSHSDLSYGHEDDHPQYQTEARGDARWLKAAGGGIAYGTHPNDPTNYINGQLELVSPSTLLMHNGGVSYIRCKIGTLAGYALRVEEPADATLRPVVCGNPTDANQLAPWGWVKSSMTDAVSGPHGPQTAWLDAGGDMLNRAYPSGALWLPVRNDPGLWKVQISADMYIDQCSAGALGEVFMSIAARWDDTGSLEWHNSNLVCSGRLSVGGGAYGQIQTATCIGYVDNRPGRQMLVCGQARGQGSANIRYIGGDYRVALEFYPWSTRTVGAIWVNF